MLEHWRAWIAVALVCGVAAWIAAPYLASAAFILDIAGTGGLARALLPARVRDVTLPEMFSRLYFAARETINNYERARAIRFGSEAYPNVGRW